MKRFTILIAAAVMLLAIMLQPVRLWGQTRTNFEINTTNFTKPSGSGSGYAAYDGNHTINGITINSTNVMVQSSNLQFKKASTSELHNTTPMPGKITRITLATSTNFTIYVGTSSNPSTTTVTSGSTITGDYTYFKIKGSNSATATTATITVEYTPTHTLTYSATNGSISGVVYGTTTPVATGASVAEGGQVTLTATPASGYSFDSWEVSGTGSTLSSTSENPTTFTMGTANATVTATFVSAGNYITVTPTEANVTASAQNIVFNVDTDQSLTASSVQFYTAASGSTETSKPDWIGTIAYDGSSSPKTLTVPVSENTGVARSAYFTLKNNTVESSVVTINQAAITVEAPTFTPAAGTYYENQSVEIACSTDGATIYYTTNGSDPTSSSTPYTSAISVTSNQTIKAIAIKNNVSSSVAEAAYTIIHPLTTMDQVFSSSETTGSYYVTLGNWVVSSVTSDTKTAYITDNAGKGFIAYYTAGSIGLSVGDVLSGTVQLTLKRYNGAAESTNLYSGTSGLIKSSGGTVIATTDKTIDDLSGVCTGSLYTLTNLTYDSSTQLLSDGDNTIKPYNQLYGDMSFVDGETYNVTGVYLQYNSTKEILPRSSADIVEVHDPAITTSPATSLSVPDYIKGTPESGIDTEILTVNGTYLTADVTVALENGASSDFEMSTDLETWGHSITLTQSNGSVANAEIAVRLKVGKSVDDYSDKIVLSSTNATTKYVNVTGSVTYAHVTYNGNGDGVSNVPEDDTDYEYEDDVTVLGEGSMTRTGYEFIAWDTKADGTGITYEEDDTFDITEDITLYAQWDAATFNLYTASMTNGSVSFTVGGNAATTAKTGQTVTLVVTPSTNYGLTNLTVTNETTSGTVSVTNNTFTMPASDIIVSATFKPVVTDNLTPSSVGINGSQYSDWPSDGKTWESDAVYKGNTSGHATPANAIQMRSSNNCGIVSTASGGKVKKIQVTWSGSEASNTNSRKLDVYGKNTAYTASSDLYNDNNKGTLLGSITYSTGVYTGELTISGDYEYVGLRANNGAIYFAEIDITWALPTYTVTYDANDGSGTMTDPDSPYTKGQTVTVLSNSFTAPDGKEFSRWNTAENGSGIYYNPGSTFEMSNSNVTLYAQWIDHCSVKATMDSDETSATCNYMQGEDRYEVDFTSKVKTLGGCDITEYGFVYSTSDETPTIGADNCVKIEVGTSYSTAGVSFNTTIANATLGATYYVRSYAINNAGTAYSNAKNVTVPSSYPTYTISYSSNGNPDGSSTVNQGNAIGTLPTPSLSYIPDGYEFVGWYNGSYSGATAPTLVKATDVPEGPMNLKAMFAISPTGGEQYLEITIDNFSEITTSYTTEFTHVYPEATIKAYGVYNNSNGIQMNSDKGTYIKNSTAMPGVITRFVLTWTATGKNSPTMYANTNSVASTSSTNLGKQSNSVTTQTINTSVSDGYKYFYFDGTTVTGACYLSSFKIYYIDYYYTTSATVPSGEYWHVNGDGELTENTIIPAGTYTLTSRLTVPEGKILTINGYLGTTPENLVVEDGGQIITSNAVNATMQKNVKAATAKDATYWYAISSAVANPSISSATNIASGTYDLYRYNEAATATNAQGQILYWENYKAHNSGAGADFTALEKGRGYLYRNASDLSIAMTGEINVADFNYPVTKTGSGPLAGFNLIGNPYSHDIYKGDGTAIPNGSGLLRTGFYYMEPTTGKWTIGTDNSTAAIKPNQGILVQTDASGDINMTNTNSNGAKYNNDNIMFKVANSQYSDETYAWFDKGRGLNKISHRNAEVPMIYINQDGEDYAIATMSDDTKMFSLNFKAMTMGKYTLSYKTKGEFNYLHVIDRLTGEDVDMLLEGEYSFVASPSDSDARFIVKLAYLPDYSDGEGDIFAYQNGSDIFVSGEGELQIFDVMGRFVMSERINGVKTISADELSKGVYVLRLVGNGMKTQKIVVK